MLQNLYYKVYNKINMKKIGLGLALVSLLTIPSCSNAIVDYHDHLNEYVERMNTYHDGFTIVQLTDLHWEIMTDVVGQRQYVQNLIDAIIAKKGPIDLIELTGDQFMFFDMAVIQDFIDFMESLNIPYAVLNGNHDRQGRAHPDWISNQYRNAENCLYRQLDNDNVYGTSNFVINLYDNESSTDCKWQIVNLDSGADYADNSFGIGMTYDYIRQDQADWWKAEHDLVGDDVPVLAFYHIAQYKMEEEWNEYEAAGDGFTRKQKFFKYERFASSTKNTTDYFYNAAVGHGLKGAFVGHAHADDWTVTTSDNVILGLGVKTGKELYYGKVTKDDAEKVGIDKGFDLIGASVMTLHDGGDFDLDHFYFDNAGFSEWVRY